MKRSIFQLIFLLSITAFFFACASTSKIVDNKNVSKTSHSPITVEIDPTNSGIIPEQALDVKAVANSIEISDEDTPFSLPPSYKFTFTEYDKAHVRTINHNPFEQSDTLYICFSSGYSMPLPGAKVISQYMAANRRTHTGIDLKTFAGDTIRAVFPGMVRMSQSYGGYGKVIVIRHYNGLETVYSHNSRNLVKIGDYVDAGQPIALTGRTGRATTEHLHFEIRIMGEHINPNKFFDFANQRAQQEGFYLFRCANGYTLKKAKDVRQNMDRPLYASVSSETPVRQEEEKKSQTIEPYEHKVQKGDTLYAIARKYNVTVNKLCELNNISVNKILQIGMRLRVR